MTTKNPLQATYSPVKEESRRGLQTVALSTGEPEYMVLSLAVQEALWWKRLGDLSEKEEAIVIHCDNRNAISVLSSRLASGVVVQQPLWLTSAGY